MPDRKPALLQQLRLVPGGARLVSLVIRTVASVFGISRDLTADPFGAIADAIIGPVAMRLPVGRHASWRQR
jgi:hypothetical protein